MDERAVSEVIAFILVFSIVVTSIGLLYTVGFGTLGDIQQYEQDRSADRAFSAVAVAFEDVQTGRATTRQARVELSGRSLSINESERLDVTLSNGQTANATGAMVYGAFEDTEIAYQSGAVLHRQGVDQQVTTRGPRFRCGEDEAVISLVQVEDGYGLGGFSSDGSVSIEAARTKLDESRLVARDTSGSTTVTVSYEGSRYERAWEHYFENEEEWTPDSSANEATCDVGEAYVRMTVVDVDFTDAG